MLMVALLLISALAVARPIEGEFTRDAYTHYPLITEDIWQYYSNYEGLYGVVYSVKDVTVDSLELCFVNGAGVTTNLLGLRVTACDTVPLLTNSVPVEILLYRTSTYTSGGTALTEFKLDQANAGTITTATYINPTGVNGTLVASWLMAPNTTWTMPTWFENTATYTVMVVIAAKKYVTIEAIWTEEE